MFSKDKFYRNLNKYRRTIQIICLLFLILIPVLILVDVRYIVGNLYSINFWDLEIVDPSMVIQTIVLSKEFYLPLIIGAVIPVVLAFIFGKVFCSWVCPYNTIIELLEFRTIKKLRRKFVKKNSKMKSNPRPLIYWLTFFSLILATLLLGYPLFTWISMPGIISSEIFSVIIGFGLGLGAVLFGIIVFAEVVTGKRYWCKYICPVGATLALFKFKQTMHISHEESVCDCSAYSEPCASACPLELRPKEKNAYPYCFNCGRCTKICEQTGNRALSFSFADKKSKKD